MEINKRKTKIIISLLITIFLLLVTIVPICFGQYGWSIGVATGGLVSIISILLNEKGSDLSLKESKVFLYLLTYFARILLFIVPITVYVILQYKVKITVFDFSFIGMAIAYFPYPFINIVVELKSKDKK